MTKFLVVEDEPLVREHVSLEIRRMNPTYQVVECKSAKEAELVMQAGSADIAILDINLNSSQSGIDIARSLRAAHPTKIIYLTAYADHQTMTAALAADPDAFLTKPFNLTQLQATIRTVANQNRVNIDLLFKNELPHILECFQILSRIITELKHTDLARLSEEIFDNHLQIQEKIKWLSDDPTPELIDELISNARVSAIIIETWPQRAHNDRVRRFRGTVDILISKLKNFASRETPATPAA